MKNKKRKILFVCTGNVARSITANVLLDRRGGYDVKSAGTHADHVGAGGIQLTQEHVEWADRIIVFEQMHVEFIQSRFGPTVGSRASRKLINLDVPDRYPAFDPELIDLLNRHLDRLCRSTGSRRGFAEPVQP